MTSVLELVKGIGVFMILGKIILQLCSGSAYEKYVQYILSLMILAQLLTGIVTLLGKEPTFSLEKEIEEMGIFSAVESNEKEEKLKQEWQNYEAELENLGEGESVVP